MVVDALDLCYTKEHIDIFVIISGDSDFSPLVSKLRENAKLVIGVGVKNSTSDLLTNNCDEFIYYDDLVADQRKQRKPVKQSAPKSGTKAKKVATQDDDDIEEAIRLVIDTAEGLQGDKGEQLWGSMVKQTLKRRRPGFNERAYGVRSFSDLLEEAENRGLLKLELDERSGGYIIQLPKIKGKR